MAPFRVGAPVGGAERAVARMTASATSSRLGGDGGGLSDRSEGRADDASVAGRERLLTVRPAADDDVAGKQALVLATSLLLFERVRLRPCRCPHRTPAPRVGDGIRLRPVDGCARRARGAGPDSRGGGRDSAPRLDSPALVAGRAGGSGRPVTHDDGEDAERQCGHEPGLRAAGQHAARRRALIGDGRGAGSRARP